MRAAVRKIYRVQHDIVFLMPEFCGSQYDNPCIKKLTKEQVRCLTDAGELTRSENHLFQKFLAEEARGIYAEIKGRLAGYAWVQYSGIYPVGPHARMLIPPKYAVVKNLYVRPSFRGQKIGQQLNLARLSIIPADYIPAVFILPENRYAIRNWEKLGFQEMLSLKQWQWAGQPWRVRVTALTDNPAAEPVKKALLQHSGAL
jgi:ribosomal protein S18 acetylase RimI-like enzyme